MSEPRSSFYIHTGVDAEVAPAALTFSGGDLELFPLNCAATIRSSLVSGGEFYVAFTTRREIAGFSIWMPPGVGNRYDGLFLYVNATMFTLMQSRGERDFGRICEETTA